MAATIIEDVRTRMAADVALSEILTGGVHTQMAGSGPPLGETLTPDAYDDGVLKPCCVLRIEATPEVEPKGMQVVIRAGFYQPMGYDQTDLAIKRTRALMDPEEVGEMYGPLDDDSYYQLYWSGAPIRNSGDESVTSDNTLGPGVSYEAALLRCEGEWPT